jgi:hypothetical protein
MTKLLEKAVEVVRQLPPRSQDEIAAAMLNLAASDAEAEEIDQAHLPAVLEGLEQARRASSQLIRTSRRYFAASVNEAARYATRA